MKIRSLNELSEALDNDIRNRKRALTSLLFSLENQTEYNKAVVSLSAICLLYSHWEGFVKYAGECFLMFVRHQGMKYDELSNGIIATCLRSEIRGLKDSKKIGINHRIVSMLRDLGDDKPKIPTAGAIETYDNLKYEVLEDILLIVGCSPDRYEKSKMFIDEKLLRHRNRIAHNGFDPEFNPDDYKRTHDHVIQLIDMFKTDVENSAANKLYKR